MLNTSCSMNLISFEKLEKYVLHLQEMMVYLKMLQKCMECTSLVTSKGVTLPVLILQKLTKAQRHLCQESFAHKQLLQSVQDVAYLLAIKTYKEPQLIEGKDISYQILTKEEKSSIKSTVAKKQALAKEHLSLMSDLDYKLQIYKAKNNKSRHISHLSPYSQDDETLLQKREKAKIKYHSALKMEGIIRNKMMKISKELEIFIHHCLNDKIEEMKLMLNDIVILQPHINENTRGKLCMDIDLINSICLTQDIIRSSSDVYKYSNTQDFVSLQESLELDLEYFVENSASCNPKPKKSLTLLYGAAEFVSTAKRFKRGCTWKILNL